MSHNTFDQFSDLVTRLTTADGTVAEEQAHELLDTALAREELEAIVAGMMCIIGRNQYASAGRVYSGAACGVNAKSSYSA